MHILNETQIQTILNNALNCENISVAKSRKKNEVFAIFTSEEDLIKYNAGADTESLSIFKDKCSNCGDAVYGFSYRARAKGNILEKSKEIMLQHSDIEHDLLTIVENIAIFMFDSILTEVIKSYHQRTTNLN